MKEFYADIDNETKNFLNEIIRTTNLWKNKAETLQKNSLVNGIKGHLLGKVFDTVSDLYDLCIK